MEFFLVVLLWAIFFFALFGFRVVRPVERALVERFGKYHRTLDQGLRWVIPFVDKVIRVNITEIRQDIEKQSVITKDNLNLSIDAVVYFKVEDVMKSIYNVQNYMTSIPSLAQTTLRSIIGELNFTEVNAQRHKINGLIEKELDTQTDAWGIDILRVELQDVHPSQDVQRAMDKVVTAEREKEAKITAAIADKEAVREASEARVIDAESQKRAAIERATGDAESVRLAAIAKAQAVREVNAAIEETFKDNSQKFKALEVTEASLRSNAKVVLTEKGINPTIVLNEGNDTVVPLN